MKRVNQIYQHIKYQEYIQKIEKYEKDRLYCRHDMNHFISVARIGYIMSLEIGLQLDKELFYSFGLLHDIGRWCQYERGEAHEKASARLAKDILRDIDFTEEECKLLLEGILAHRSKSLGQGNDFKGIMYRADKASRECFSCKVKERCNWSDEKKNLIIKI